MASRTSRENRVAHRDDIQGLRAVAVLIVVLDHAGVPFLRGGYVGVDVFFVLSGFLITGLLLAQVRRAGRVSLWEFYVRRARRILPAAVLTLVATDVAAYFLLNFVRARDAIGDSVWAALFAANWHFADRGADYFAQTQVPSPFQHFWTLSVEEQFYLVWPLLLAALVGSAAPRRRGTLGAAVAAAGLASLAWSIWSAHAGRPDAYFSTFTRAWELALGAALALAAAKAARMPRSLQVLAGWSGVVCIGAAAVVFSAGAAFPGYAALVPAVGAALTIAAGIPEQLSRAGPARLLALPPLRYVGDRSYAFYLWHWPVLVLATEVAARRLSLVENLALAAGAFLLSVVSYALYENPIRRMRFRVPSGAVLWPASASIVLAAAVVLLTVLGRTAAQVDAAAASVRPPALVDPTARALADAVARPLPAVVAAVRAAQRGAPIPWPVTPSVTSLRGDHYRFADGCSAAPHETTSKLCRLGDLTSAKTIVVIGDSHAQMWMPAILRMATRDRWVVVPLVKQTCIPRSWPEGGDCGTWYRWARARAAALRPDVALVAASWAGTYGPRLAIRPVATLARALERTASSVIVVGDAPTPARDPTDCLLASGATMATCTATARRPQLASDDAIAAATRRAGAGFINTRGWFCARARTGETTFLCPLVINRTIAWMDSGHVSETYASELAPVFRNAFRRALFG